jgi:Flp pilus assembly protein TadG
MRQGEHGRDRGSVLMLVPAAVLVLVVLGAIAVDSAVVFLAQRDLANRTAAAANDIAGSAASDAAFYGEGRIAIDVDTARRITAAAFSPAVRPDGYERWAADVRVVDGDQRTVEVTATAEVHYVFATAIPGVHHTATVSARSVATARGG